MKASLEVDDIERLVIVLRERGVPATPVKMGEDNSWQSWIADPDGNQIELHCYTPKSKQLATRLDSPPTDA